MVEVPLGKIIQVVLVVKVDQVAVVETLTLIQAVELLEDAVQMQEQQGQCLPLKVEMVDLQEQIQDQVEVVEIT